jgi:hypothetical protein
VESLGLSCGLVGQFRYYHDSGEMKPGSQGMPRVPRIAGGSLTEIDAGIIFVSSELQIFVCIRMSQQHSQLEWFDEVLLKG